MQREPNWLSAMVDAAFATLSPEDFTEFHRLVQDVEIDNPEARLTPHDILVMIETAMFNNGSASLEDIEEAHRQLGLP